ncbi:MAG: amidohydrolase family protein [Chloroflexi bacterium]|nr:amidohydrolase family protein [Chloroflexota bacterium]
MHIFYNGVIHTMDPAYPNPDIIIVDDEHGTIDSVGGFDFRNTMPSMKRVDLAGRTLLPGFNDAHVHIWKLGLLLTVQVDARRSVAPDMAAIIEQFRQRASETAAGVWLSGRGYNEVDLPEKRHPTRDDLDRATTNHPIALTRTCGHMIVANSMALELAGITSETPDPPGGVIVRDSQGQPTGLLQETAMGLITRVIPPYDDETMGRAIRAAMAHQLSLGITSATDPLLTPDHLRVYRQLDSAGLLDVRVNGLPIRRADGGTNTYPLPERYVSDFLRIDTVKFFADGGLSGATAAISEPYQVTGDQGVLRFQTNELAQLMWEAHEHGFRIGTHAIGDIALDQVIGIYEELNARKPGLRHRIEHLGLPTADHLRRVKAIDAIAVPQTVFLSALGTSFRRYLPPHFLPRCYPVRAMLNAGLDVALSSDAPVVPDDNPLLGIKAAVDRFDPLGEAIAPEQTITPYEALYAYTMGGAMASGDAANRGSITPGKWADLIILSGDPLREAAISPERLLDIQVEQVYVGGKLVYSV